MTKNKILIFIGVLFVCPVYAVDTPDYIGMQLDAQIAELTSRRDKLKSDLEACEKNTRGFKIAGISTLTATGVGVVANIKLAKDIEEQKTLKGKGGGGYSGGGGAGGTVQEDTCAKDPICSWERQCKMTGYTVTNCDHDTDCCAADGCPCEK
ncbi:MAG: hypothetical protein J6S80_04040 [Alphaproteobacteria bacterium]|nr:hypothetical protein [Alphaproteobacteria bacterium]